MTSRRCQLKSNFILYSTSKTSLSPGFHHWLIALATRRCSATPIFPSTQGYGMHSNRPRRRGFCIDAIALDGIGGVRAGKIAVARQGVQRCQDDLVTIHLEERP
jgi:hypothetical protein